MKTRYIISIAILLAIVSAWYLLMLAPQMKKAGEIRASLETSDRMLNDFKNIIERFPQYFKAQKELSSKRRMVLSKLYTKDDLIKLFDKIESESERYNLRLVEITPSIEELLKLNRMMQMDNQPHSLDIEIKQRGSLQNIGEYMRFIESQEFYHGMNHCRISNPVETRQFSDLTFGFKAILGTIREK